MSVLNTMVRARIRAIAAKWLKDRCNITVQTTATGPLGEQLDQYVSVQSNVPCRVIKVSMSPSAMIVGGQESMQDMYRVSVPVGTALAVDQRIELSNGLEYDVVDLETELTDEMFEHALVSRQRARGE
jgi:hypothetical protein